jgi:hypothetical protein
VIHGCDFLSCAVDAPGRGNSSIPFDALINRCFVEYKTGRSGATTFSYTFLDVW